MERCGVYQIHCNRSGALYVGSSKRIYARWQEHKKLLRRHKSPCIHLQHAWTKHGEDAFFFSVLEECSQEVLRQREQHYIDLLKPTLNVMTEVSTWTPSEEMKARNAAIQRERARLRTHCPHGHVYDEANTYIGKKGEKVCRACANFRTTAVYALETPKQREVRRQKVARYNATSIEQNEKRRLYALAHKEQKRIYDKARYESGIRPPLLRVNMTAEQRDQINAGQRKNYLKRKMRAIT